MMMYLTVVVRTFATTIWHGCISDAVSSELQY
jgi:hypothetical protein